MQMRWVRLMQVLFKRLVIWLGCLFCANLIWCKPNRENGPLGGYGALNTHEFAHIFQSPGPIYEPGGVGRDWWRIGRFLNAVGIGAGDIVQNCFGYHLTPAGMIFENGARAVNAAVVPAGVGQTELQVRAASDIGTTLMRVRPII
jgi:phenylacetate-CoA ligase